MRFLCIRTNDKYDTFNVHNFHQRITCLMSLSSLNEEYNYKLFESEFGYKLTSEKVDYEEEHGIKVYDGLNYSMYTVRSGIWDKKQQFRRPLPSFIFSTMCDLSNPFTSYYIDGTIDDYHILVEDYN